MGFEKHVIMQQSVMAKKEVQNGHSLNCKKVQCKTGFKRNKMTCMLNPLYSQPRALQCPNTPHIKIALHTQRSKKGNNLELCYGQIQYSFCGTKLYCGHAFKATITIATK